MDVSGLIITTITYNKLSEIIFNMAKSKNKNTEKEDEKIVNSNQIQPLSKEFKENKRNIFKKVLLWLRIALDLVYKGDYEIIVLIILLMIGSYFGKFFIVVIMGESS